MSSNTNSKSTSAATGNTNTGAQTTTSGNTIQAARRGSAQGFFKQLSQTTMSAAADLRRSSASSASGGNTSPGGFEAPTQDMNGRRGSQGRFSQGKV